MQDDASQSARGSLDEVLGFEDFSFDGEATATGTMAITERVKQPFGIVHGGAYAALAESITSRATFMAVAPDLGAVGQANESLFFRPATKGTIRATATALHRGRTSWVWDVRMVDDDDNLCATTRVIIAVRPFRFD